MDHSVIDTPIGRLAIWEIHGCITECAWVMAPLREGASPLLAQAAREVSEYFKKQRRTFDLPLALPGTELEQQVWREILRIPYGRTMTAAAIAKKLGKPRQIRAVIAACTSNPAVLFVPCHRVTAEDGEGSYVGGADIKRALWALEGIARTEKKK